MNNEGEIKSIPHTGTDQERAAALKSEMEAVLNNAVSIIQKAKDSGFIITFGIGDGPMGRTTITALFVDRRY